MPEDGFSLPWWLFSFSVLALSKLIANRDPVSSLFVIDPAQGVGYVRSFRAKLARLLRERQSAVQVPIMFRIIPSMVISRASEVFFQIQKPLVVFIGFAGSRFRS